MTSRTAVTANELLSYPKPEAGDYELDEGELVYVSPNNIEHEVIRGRLIRLLQPLVDRAQAGMLTFEAGYELAPGVVRAPDIGLMTTDQFAKTDPKGFAPFAPILAIEIQSPGQSSRDTSRKVNAYLAAGTRQVWVFYPDARTVAIFGETGPRVCGPEDTLEAADILPGLSVRVGDILR